MGCQSSVVIGNDLTFTVDTHNVTTQQVSDADAAPTYRVYENETGTPILTGSMAKLDDAGTTGYYSETIACTIANGFEIGKSYSVRVVGVVGGITSATSFGFTVSDIATTGGSGARTVTFAATDGNAALESEWIRLTKGAESYARQTNAAGGTTLSVGDGTWNMAVSLPGYTYNSATQDGNAVTNSQIVVSGDHNVAIVMDGESFAASNVGCVTGYLTVYDANFALESGVPIVCEMTAIPDDDVGIAYDSATRTVNSAANTALCEFPNLVKGGTYKFYRGADETVGTFSVSAVTTVTIPTNATSPYALPSIIGEDA